METGNFCETANWGMKSIALYSWHYFLEPNTILDLVCSYYLSCGIKIH